MKDEKKSGCSTIRNFLRENKIFFETIGVVFLSGMAIYISFQMRDISKRQLQLLEKSSLPNFEVSTNYFDKNKIGDYAGFEILIYNSGDYPINLDAETAVFITYSYTTQGKAPQIGMLPLHDYLDSGCEEIESSKAKWKIKGSVLNHHNYRSLKEWLEKDFAKENIDFKILSLYFVFRLNYRDKFNEEHAIFYHVLPSDKANIMSSEIARKYFSKYFDTKDYLSVLDYDFQRFKTMILKNKK